MQHGNISFREMFGQQPAPVWVMAFITMVGFMGIGLVDPILTSIAHGLNATPSQVSLLFTSYFAITSLMMLVVGVVLSRFGGKATLLVGLFLIALFAGLSGFSTSIQQLVMFRAGWGLGNAFFVVTALSMIVASAVGSREVPVLLYEAFLGLGISIGPLVGALLGDMSWRYPFFGTAFLMLLGFLACLFLLKKPAAAPAAQKITFGTTFKTFTHRGLLLNALSAFFYNYGMFTLLAFVPFVLNLSPYAIGAIFFGWGLMLALFSVMMAPRLKRSFGNARILGASLLALALLFLLICVGSKAWIIVAVIAAGAFMGLNNTAYTEIALEIAPFPRASASASYNCIRWFGGVVAPFTAAELAERFGHSAPFLVAAVCACVAIGLIYVNRQAITALEEAHEETVAQVVATVTPASAAAHSPLRNEDAPILVAIDGTSATASILAFVQRLFAGSTAPIHVLHVRLIESVEGVAEDIESDEGARALVQQAVDALKIDGNGKTITGAIIDSSVGRISASIYQTAEQLHAQLIVIGARHKNSLSTLLRGSVSEDVLRHAKCPVLVLPEKDEQGTNQN